MFDFLFQKYSRRQKTKILLTIIDHFPADIYTKQLYSSSLEILDDTEFEDFYMKISGTMKNQQITSNIQSIAPSIQLPGINSF